jgi:hypothetical protein
MYLGQAAARAALPGHHAQLEIGVPGQQPEQLASGISAGTRHRHPRAHVILAPSARSLALTRSRIIIQSSD